MQLITILNHCHRFRGLVYQQARFSPDTPADIRIFRVTATVISVLDYSKGFAHTDLITC